MSSTQVVIPGVAEGWYFYPFWHASLYYLDNSAAFFDTDRVKDVALSYGADTNVSYCSQKQS